MVLRLFFWYYISVNVPSFGKADISVDLNHKMNRIARVLAMAPARAAMVRQPVQASLRPFKHGVRFASSSKVSFLTALI